LINIPKDKFPDTNKILVEEVDLDTNKVAENKMDYLKSNT